MHPIAAAGKQSGCAAIRVGYRGSTVAGSGILSVRPGLSVLSARGQLALPGVLALAAAVFSYRLGSSSLFLDEVYTWYTVRGDLAGLESHVVDQEVAPPLYYLLLHGWVLVTGADSETMLRIPSVAAGVALVASVYWLGSLLGGRRAGLLSAALIAVSPLALLYAQQARAYIWAMLAVTVAAAAAIEAVRRRSGGWLAAAAAAGAAALLTHYTAVLVVAVVAVWVLLRKDAFEPRARGLFFGALALPLLALAPLAAEQLSHGYQAWTDQLGRLKMDTALQLLGTPFDGRFDETSTLARQAGAAVAVAAVAILAVGERLLAIRERRLVAAAALVPIATVLLLSGIVHPVAMTRYTAVAAPFVLVAIAVVALNVQRTLGAVLVGVALVLSVMGVGNAARPEGRWPDTRGTISTVADRWGEGDRIVAVGGLLYPDSLMYYARRALPEEGHAIRRHPTLTAAVDGPDAMEATRRRRRIWMVANPPLSRSDLRYALGLRGYRVRREWRLEGLDQMQLVLAVPKR